MSRCLCAMRESCDVCRPGGRNYAITKADALALWAVRVLDAHGDYRLIASEPASVRVHRGSQKTLIFWGGTPDAARLAAAEALAPELGDKCPVRP